MLVISRNTQQTFYVGDNVKITVLAIDGKTAKIGIDAPKEIQILREEVKQRIERGDPMPEKKASSAPQNKKMGTMGTVLQRTLTTVKEELSPSSAGSN